MSNLSDLKLCQDLQASASKFSLRDLPVVQPLNKRMDASRASQPPCRCGTCSLQVSDMRLGCPKKRLTNWMRVGLMKFQDDCCTEKTHTDRQDSFQPFHHRWNSSPYFRCPEIPIRSLLESFLNCVRVFLLMERSQAQRETSSQKGFPLPVRTRNQATHG